MATSNYPASLDTTSALPASISDTANLNSPNHAEMHEVYNDAIIEIEEKVGIGDTTPTSGAILVGTGTGQSAWDTTPTFVNDVTVTTGRLFAAGGDDVDLDALSGAAIIGSTDGSGQHLAIDGNEIQSKSDATTAATLNLNILGGQIKIHDGTSSAPAIGFHDDTNTGIYRATTDTMGFAGKLALATALPTTSSTGYATLRRMDADGAIKEYTSSERFKKDITDISVSDAYKVLDARPIHFRDKNDDSSVPLEAGLSAESLHDSGWTYAVTYDNGTTTPRGIHYEMLVAPLIAIVKDLSTRLAALEG